MEAEIITSFKGESCNKSVLHLECTDLKKKSPEKDITKYYNHPCSSLQLGLMGIVLPLEICDCLLKDGKMN